MPSVIFNGTSDIYGKVARVYRDKIVLLNHLESVGKLQLVLTPGHTPSHSAYRIRSHGKTLMVVGDTLPSRTTVIQQPEWNILSNTNRTQAIETRIQLMEMPADEETMVSIYHETFPGLGYIVRDRYTFDFSATGRFPQN